MLRYNVVQNTLDIKDELSPPAKNEVIWVRIDKNYTQQEQNDFIEELETYPLAKEKTEQFSELPMVDVFENEAVISIFAIQEDYSFVKVNILVGKNYVITIEDEHSEGLFLHLVDRFKEHPEYMSHTGKILYHLIDEISTDYLRAVDRVANEILELEKEVFITPFENRIGKSIYRWKIQLHQLRQVVEYQGV
ncbi:CorA family divalent cation transporter [Tepidibacillus marianensis]|uniref:CorA family divalent cation transporter n=1 Tax=Tepidibacillus marianensis TaxID=3131995 RepID=UPI0030CEA708